MKLRAIITVIGVSAALGGTGAFLLPASASPRDVTHTLTFTAVKQASVKFSRTLFAVSDKDVNHAGKVIGYDLVRFSFNPKTRKVSGRATLVGKGGFLYAMLSVSDNRVTRGRVTGGTGAFRGATGTVIAKDLNKAGTRTAVTIKYHS